MQRVLAPIDFSGITGRVLDNAAALVEAFGGRLWLLHVAPPDPEFVGFEAGPQTVRSTRADHLRDEHRRLQQRADALSARGVPTEALLVQGQVVEQILDHARRLEIDTIVLGSHGHGALLHLLLGSVSESVLRQAPCPLLIIPPQRDR